MRERYVINTSSTLLVLVYLNVLWIYLIFLELMQYGRQDRLVMLRKCQFGSRSQGQDVFQSWLNQGATCVEVRLMSECTVYCL